MKQLLAALLGRKHGGDRLAREALIPCRIDEVWHILCCSIKCRHNIRVRQKYYLLSMMVSILPSRTMICGLCVAALESGSSIRVASSAHKFHGYVYLKENVDLCSFFMQRSNGDIFSARAGHFISTKPCGCCSLGSVTKPSDDAPIQLN